MEKYYLKILGCLSVIFFALYLFLYWGVVFSSPDKSDRLIFNQPDESVQYFFAKNIVENMQFGVFENLSDISQNQVHPRGMTVIKDKLEPIGFPGLAALSGLVAFLLTRILGLEWINHGLLILVPAFGAVAPLLFFGFLRRVFNNRVAFVSALLLFILPPWWYESSRVFQQPVMFMAFLLVGYYSFMRMYRGEGSTSLWPFLFGLGVGLALFIRPAEALWVAVLFVALCLLAIKKCQLKQFLLIIAGLSLGLACLFATQILFYGSPFASGYVRPEASGAAGSVFSGPQGISFAKSLVAPFGFSPKTIIWTGYNYLIKLFFSWSFLVVCGLFYILFAFRNKVFEESYRKRVLAYVIGCVVLSACLLLYYGSWRFSDNLNESISIGSSQIRYFLPIFVFFLPFASIFILRFLEMRQKVAGAVLFTGVFLILFLTSYRAVFMNFEGLSSIHSTLEEYKNRFREVSTLVAPGGVVVTRYADKYLFPDIKIIAGIEGDYSLRAIQSLVQAKIPVYWYDLPYKDDEKKILQQNMSDFELQFSSSTKNIHGFEFTEIVPILVK